MAELSFEQICERLGIDQNLRKHVAPSAPLKGKIAVAKGLLPAPAKTLLAMQYVLLGDADDGVRSETERSLLGLPESRLLGLLDRDTHPKLLEFLAYRRQTDQRLLERIALSHQVNDKTLCYLAESGTQRVTEIVGGNQERLITTPHVLRFLQRNPNAAAALIDRVKSFQRLYDIQLPDPEVVRQEELARNAAHAEVEEAARMAAEQAQARTQPASSPPPEAEVPRWDDPPMGMAPTEGGLPYDFVPGEVYIPPAPAERYDPPAGLLNPLQGLMADWGIDDRPDWIAPPDGPGPGSGVAADGPPAAPLVDASALTVAGSEAIQRAESDAAVQDVDISGMSSLSGTDFRFDFDEESTEFSAEFVDKDYEDDDAVKEGLAQQISKMTTGQKIKLAYKGNKSVRELLVRDSNKIVGVAVIKSGRITENEVMSIAINRGINEDVIRALSENREYTRKYPIKVALVNNPKTPIPTAMTLLNSLHVKDLQRLSKNRNVSAAIFTAATKLFKARKASMR